MFATLFALIVFAIALIWIGATYRGATSAEYHIAARRASAVRVAASTFALIGGGEFVTLTALSYGYGYWTMIYFVGIVLGFFVLGQLAGRARAGDAEADLQSIPDFLGLGFGRLAGFTATALAFVSLAALLLIQFLVGGTMLSAVTGFPLWTCVLGMALVVTVYLYVGGFQSVLATDLVQGTVMFLVIVVLVVAYAAVGPSGGSVPQAHAPIPLGESVPLVALGFFAVLGGADVWQRVYAGESNRAVRSGLRFAAGAWLIFGLLFVTFAVTLQQIHPDADPNEAFFAFLGGDLPAWLAAMMSLLLFSALLSTADTELFLLSVLIQKEYQRQRGIDRELPLRVTRRILLVLAVASALLALVFQNLIGVYFFLLYLMMIVGPLALARLLGRGNRATILIGLWGGLAVFLALLVTGRLAGWYQLAILLPAALTFVPRAQARGTASE